MTKNKREKMSGKEDLKRVEILKEGPEDGPVAEKDGKIFSLPRCSLRWGGLKDVKGRLTQKRISTGGTEIHGAEGT